MLLEVSCLYDIEYEFATITLCLNDQTSQYRENLKKNIFIPIRKALESKNNALLNMRNDSIAVRKICELQLRYKTLETNFIMKYEYNGDEYKIEEREDHLEVINTYATKKKQYKSYKIKGDVCNCMSYRMGNSKYGKKNCKHMEMVRKAPVELKGM